MREVGRGLRGRKGATTIFAADTTKTRDEFFLQREQIVVNARIESPGNVGELFGVRSSIAIMWFHLLNLTLPKMFLYFRQHGFRTLKDLFIFKSQNNYSQGI